MRDEWTQEYVKYSNEVLKENIIDEIESMTVHDFQNLVEKYDLEAHIIDGMVFDLVHAIFEERSK